MHECWLRTTAIRGTSCTSSVVLWTASIHMNMYIPCQQLGNYVHNYYNHSAFYTIHARTQASLSCLYIYIYMHNRPGHFSSSVHCEKERNQLYGRSLRIN